MANAMKAATTAGVSSAEPKVAVKKAMKTVMVKDGISDIDVEEFVQGAAKKEVIAAMKGCTETAKSLTGDAKTQKHNKCRSSNAKRALAASWCKSKDDVDADEVNVFIAEAAKDSVASAIKTATAAVATKNKRNSTIKEAMQTVLAKDDISDMEMEEFVEEVETKEVKAVTKGWRETKHLNSSTVWRSTPGQTMILRKTAQDLCQMATERIKGHEIRKWT